MRAIKYGIEATPIPTLLLGMASALDPFGSIGLSVRAELPESVEEALAQDWEAVYGDIAQASDRVLQGPASL